MPDDDDDFYEEDPFGLGPNPQLGPPLTRAQLDALGIPSPAEVAASLRTSKVTLALDTDAIAFFKTQAKKHKVPYQAMIRRVVSDYVARASKPESRA
ncbi:MAG: hypothetical protein ACKVOE_01325 [Rickettsiales bacterium]